MKCDNCPAHTDIADGYDYEEFICLLNVEAETFNDGTDGCRKSFKAIERRLEGYREELERLDSEY